ncbi:MAG: NAD(P)-dependent oxidoreductase [Planctomycetia bacterium]|nr:NAD(P)-dependent oxidoreductase [Planctomycetia bacterium]
METNDALEDSLSQPSECAVEALARLQGDLMFLGAGGKMGLSLVRMALRASQAAGVRRRVIAVSRFSEPGKQAEFETQGLEALPCDLLDRGQVDELPECANIVFMTGMKFGSTGQMGMTWAMNCLVPALVAERFRHSRIVAFSTGNIYGLTRVGRGGSRESDSPQPVGEYAMSCLGRERVFEHYSALYGTSLAILRLNYACELRYGVLVDLAESVWQGKPIDLSMGHVNVIWQGDANAMALAAFGQVASPPAVLNLAGPETLSVRDVCLEFGRLFGKTPTFTGAPADDALLSNSSRATQLFGPPRVLAADLVPAIAEWIRRGGTRLGKPTKFQSRDGKF